MGSHSSTKSQHAPWPDLPPELLERIAGVLSPRDRVAVRLVCSSWRACVKEYFVPTETELPFEAPRLLHRRPGTGTGGALAFFSLQHRRILPFALPAGPGRRCCGQFGGWLAMASDTDRSASLLLCNPASGKSIPLPPPPVFPVSKVLLSAPPTTSESWVAAALSRTGTLVVFQFQPPAVSSSSRSAACWTRIGVREGAQHGGFIDMAFWSDRLCALGHDGAVLGFDDDDLCAAAVAVLLREAEHAVGVVTREQWRLYLMETDGELFLVRRLYHVRMYTEEVELDVEVLVLLSEPEEDDDECQWGQVVEMPGRALFVGSVASASVAVAMYPAAGLQENCVYFARREVEMLAPHAICCYCLLDDEMTTLPIPGGHSADVEPVWITPFV